MIASIFENSIALFTKSEGGAAAEAGFKSTWTYGEPSGMGVSYERGTPVPEAGFKVGSEAEGAARLSQQHLESPRRA